MESTSVSWSSSGVYQESIRSPSGVHQESIRSLSGVHQEYQDFIRTPDGLHQDSWGSVTYRPGVTVSLGSLPLVSGVLPRVSESFRSHLGPLSINRINIFAFALCSPQ